MQDACCRFHCVCMCESVSRALGANCSQAFFYRANFTFLLQRAQDRRRYKGELELDGAQKWVKVDYIRSILLHSIRRARRADGAAERVERERAVPLTSGDDFSAGDQNSRKFTSCMNKMTVVMFPVLERRSLKMTKILARGASGVTKLAGRELKKFQPWEIISSKNFQKQPLKSIWRDVSCV